MERNRIEKKMEELVDWSTVRYHTEMIEVFIGKMERHKRDYLGDIRWELKDLEELFREAEEKAHDLLIEEEDGAF